MEILVHISSAIGIVGIVVIIWGLLVSTVEFILMEFKRFRGKNICNQREHLRHHLGSYLLLGLEILIAADIVRTVYNPTLHDLGILGAIVAVRTVMSFFLNKELSGAHNCADN